VDEAPRKLRAEAGCDGFLPKPVRLVELLERLERHLDLAWVRAPRTSQETAPKGPAMAPPPEVLERLADLAERGRIPEFLEALQALEGENPQLQAWSAEVRALAEGYQIHDLCARLASG
jgi:hypothetical protein